VEESRSTCRITPIVFSEVAPSQNNIKKKRIFEKTTKWKKKKNETTYTYPISPLAHIPKPSLNLKRLKAKSINNPFSRSGPATSPPS
jgi:hypothetical protein